jgi:ABC-2 type transport system permease protein
MCAANAVASRPRAPGALSTYPRVARAAVRRYSSYRLATLASALEYSVASMVRAFVLLAVVRARGPVRGFDAEEAVTFAFLAGGIEVALWLTAPTEIDGRIRTGDVITDLQRPVDFQGWWLSHEAGRAVYMVLTRGVPPYLFGLVVLHILAPASAGAALLFALSLALAFLVSFAWRFLVSLSGFWLLDTRGVVSIAGAIVTFASGALVPLDLLPTALGDALRVLPFAGMVQTPFDVFTGNRGALPAMAGQVVWAAGLLLIGRLVLRRAAAKVVVQGG